MSDRHLDPPEYDEPPECSDCQGFGELDGETCRSCDGEGFDLDAVGQPDPPEEPFEEFPTAEDVPPEPSENCQHGNEHGSCDACDHLGDLAFDAARERGRR